MRFAFLISVFLTCTISADAVAQKPLVQMKLELLSIRGRTGGPTPVLVKLEHSDKQLLEGDLLLTVYQSQQTPDDILVNLRYEGIVLQGTDYFLKILIPPVEHSWNMQYLITGWFETVDGDRISLSRDPKNPNDPHELLTPSPLERTTLVCSCSGREDFRTPSKNLAFLNRILSLENYDPTASDDSNNSSDPSTNYRRGTSATLRYYAAAWDALALPENPLYYTSFDIVVLADRALGHLNSRQLDALTVWVRAGGSLCVVADEQSLKSEHVSFLKAIFESPDDPSVRIQRNETGRLEVMTDRTVPAIDRRFGLGAVSLLPRVDSLEEAFSEADKGQLVGHLWKVRYNSGIREGLPWLDKQTLTSIQRRNYQLEKRDDGWYAVSKSQFGNRKKTQARPLAEVVQGRHFARDLSPGDSTLTLAAGDALMPNGVQMVPSWVVAVLLFSYVLCIGPLDYWILGMLNARKFTWILFPVVTAVFTVLTIMIAHSYMASTETGGRLSIVDLVEDGTPARQSVLQMNFYGANTEVSKDFKQTFQVPITSSSLQDNGWNMESEIVAENKPLTLSGRFPQKFQSQVTLSQWDPFLTRTLQFEPKVEGIPSIDWKDSSLVTSPEGRKELERQLNAWIESETVSKTSETDVGATGTEASNPDEIKADAMVMHLSQLFPIRPTRNSAYFRSESDLQQIDRKFRLGNQYQYVERTWSPEELLGATIVTSSAAPLMDNFGIVSQISPQGDSSLEDLPVIDLWDPNQWLLLICVERGSQIQIFRKVFHVD